MDQKIIKLIGINNYCLLNSLDDEIFPYIEECKEFNNHQYLPKIMSLLAEGISVNDIRHNLENYIKCKRYCKYIEILFTRDEYKTPEMPMNQIILFFIIFTIIFSVIFNIANREKIIVNMFK